MLALTMKKSLFLLLGFTLFLAACGGGTTVAKCDQDYWDGTYGTCLPAGWAVVDRETLRQRGVPDETIAAFKAEASVSGQFPSITVTREALSQPMTPNDYSEASMRSVSVLPGYSLADTKKVTIDGESLSLHIFTAQPVETDPARRFYQLSTSKDSVGYTVTAAVPMFIDDSVESEVLLILKSSTLVQPE